MHRAQDRRVHTERACLRAGLTARCAAPGGGTHFVARMLSGKLTKNLGQPIWKGR